MTFCSDAHAPAEVGWGYEKTLELARSCGVAEYVAFEKRTLRSRGLCQASRWPSFLASFRAGRRGHRQLPRPANVGYSTSQNAKRGRKVAELEPLGLGVLEQRPVKVPVDSRRAPSAIRLRQDQIGAGHHAPASGEAALG